MNADHQAQIRACLDTLQHAQNLVNKAAQQLCPVPGFADEWSDLHKPYDAVKAAWHRVEARRVALQSPRPDDRCVCCLAPLRGESTCEECGWVQPAPSRPTKRRDGRCPDCRASLPGDGSCCDACGWMRPANAVFDNQLS